MLKYLLKPTADLLKTLFWKLYYKLTMKDYSERVKFATGVYSDVVASSAGRLNHFYDINGVKIREFSNDLIKSRKIEHPLIAKYK